MRYQIKFYIKGYESDVLYTTSFGSYEEMEEWMVNYLLGIKIIDMKEIYNR